MKRTIWAITKDLLADEFLKGQNIPTNSNLNAVGKVGPRHAPEIFAHDWNNGSTGPLMLANMIAGHASASRFRLFDADGELYYQGVILVGDDNRILAPLDDFGMPNAGCTDMEIQEIPDGPWNKV